MTMANKLADMHEIAPKLTEAVAGRITSSDLLEKATRDMGGFVHMTTVLDSSTYAVRIDDGALLDAHQEVERARAQLTAGGREQLASILACEPDKLDKELDALAARAKERAVKIPITSEVRDRARAGRFAYVHQRGRDFADTIWVIDPVFIIELVHQELEQHADDTPAREEAYFAGARLNDDEELRAAGREDHERRKAERARQAEATNSNLGLGHDLRAGLIEPTPSQRQALKAIVCHLLARHYRDVIAYGAGWSNQDRQQPVGEHGRHEPRHIEAIVDAELQAALDERDPLRGIAQLTASWATAFALDPDGITRTKTLGTERMGRKSQTRSPADTTCSEPPSGSSCGQCSPPASQHCTATRSYSTSPSRRPCSSTRTAANQTSPSSTSAKTSTPLPSSLLSPHPSVLPTGTEGPAAHRIARSHEGSVRVRRVFSFPPI